MPTIAIYAIIIKKKGDKHHDRNKCKYIQKRRATQLAAKLGQDPKLVSKTMQDIFRRGIKIMVNRAPRPMIYRGNWNHCTAAEAKKNLRLHPLALDKFIEILNTQGNTK